VEVAARRADALQLDVKAMATAAQVVAMQ